MTTPSTNSPLADQPPPGLPLTPFERLMWYDDRPGYPMVCYCESTYVGLIERSAFERAVALALPRHPLLGAQINSTARPLRWTTAAGAAVPIHWQSSPDDYPGCFWQGIDLTRDLGVRFVVHADAVADRTRILMQLHHACVDGVGGLVFLGDVLGFYHHLLGDPLPRSLAKPPDTAALARRGDILPPEAPPPAGERAPDARPPVSAAAEALKHAWRFATFRPARVSRARRAAPAPADRERSNQPYAVQDLSAESTSVLRAHAVAQGVALNDLLLRDLFLELDAWNRDHRRPWARRRLRVLMPLSMRTAAHRRLPAANLMSYGFLQRRPDELADPQSLLAGIAWETRGVLQQRLGNLFLAGLEPLARLGRGFRAALRAPACFSTAVLSNLGDPIRRMHCRFPLEAGRVRVGNLTLQSLYGVPPVRPGTNLAIALTAYQGALGFMAVGCPRKLGPHGAAELLDRYLERLRRTAGESRTPTPAAARPPELAGTR